MEKIIYCCPKTSGRFFLRFNFIKVTNLKKACLSSIPLVIFSERFLKRKKLDPSRLASKICLIHFAKEHRNNTKLVKKYGFFDYFTDGDSKERILFKLYSAQKFIALKEKIKSLEAALAGKERRIEKISLIDPLSGCYNWRYFMHHTHRELSRARRHLYNVSFVVIDIDYFRQINEVYGVSVGDAVIKKIVALLQEEIRKEDTVCRWMEDEFFLIFPHLSREDTYKVAERIKDKITTHKFKYKSFTLSVKVSVGVVSFPGDNVCNTKDVITALHSCLSIAKSKGGNLVVFYSKSQQNYLEKKKRVGNVNGFKTKIEKLNALLTRDLLEMIYGFARAIEAKDSYTGKHVEYTALIAEKIARELNLPAPEIENIKHAAVLHDLGKVGIDERILSKKTSLSAEEQEIIKTHPWTAAEILREIHALRGAIPAILYHHERFDGKGYPLGLKGEEIPLGARVVAIADVYQALVSDRPYRKAYSKKKAVAIIKKEIGTHFDPQVAKIFLLVIKEIK